MTIYELTEGERATMKKLIDGGLVVTIGEHAKAKRDLADAITMLQGIARSCRNHGYDTSAKAVEEMLEEVLGR